MTARVGALCLALLVSLVWPWAVSAAASATSDSLAPPWSAYRQAVSSGAVSDAVAAANAVAEAARQAEIEYAPEWSAVLLHDANALIRRGEWASAIAIGQAAAALSPGSPDPHRWLAAAWWRMPERDLRAAIGEYAAAWKASFTEFWSLLHRVERVITAAVLSLLSVLALVTIVTAWRVIPLLAHVLEEWSGHRIFRPTAWLTAAWLILLPWVLVPWHWGLIAAPAAVMWWFLTRAERWLFAVLVTLAIGVAVVSPRMLGLLVADRDPEVRLLADVAQHAPAGPALSAASPQGDTPEGVAARALALGREGREADAAALYQEGIQRWPNDARLLLNEGNRAFYRREYAKAIERYEAASVHAPQSVAILFNLSQAYRADLRFEEGEARYQAARALDVTALDRYAERARRGEGFLVVDAPIRAAEVWAAAAAPRTAPAAVQDAFERITGRLNVAVLLGVLGVFGLCGLLARALPHQAAVPCVTCGTAVCRRCQRYFLDLKLCPACWKAYAKGIKLHPNATLPQARRYWERRRRYAAALAIIPGAGHVALGRPWWGAVSGVLVGFAVWTALLSTSWNTLGERLIPSPWYSVWGPVIALAAMVGLWGARHLLTQPQPVGSIGAAATGVRHVA